MNRDAGGQPHLSTQTQTPAEPCGGLASYLEDLPPDKGHVYVRSDDPMLSELPDVPAPVVCPHCGALRHTVGFILLMLPGRVFWDPDGAQACVCPQGQADFAAERAKRKAQHDAQKLADDTRRLRETVQRLVGQSGMGERFRRRTFATFQTDDTNRHAFQCARQFAENFSRCLPRPGMPEPKRNGLFFTGAPGTGKTHLAAAVANHLLDQGIPVICMTMIELLARIRRTYDHTDGHDGDVLWLYKTVPLLVIDDIGKEKPTEWAISTVYDIINGRYEAYLPTVVTTNYDEPGLIRRLTPPSGDEYTPYAAIDRLREMCIGLTLSGGSWRLR